MNRNIKQTRESNHVPLFVYFFGNLIVMSKFANKSIRKGKIEIGKAYMEISEKLYYNYGYIRNLEKNNTKYKLEVLKWIKK